jgi:hypothetical protein
VNCASGSAETTISSKRNGTSCARIEQMARSASPPTRSTGMITDTFGGESEPSAAVDLLTESVGNPHSSAISLEGDS